MTDEDEKTINNVIQGPWNNLIDVQNDADPSEFENVITNVFDKINPKDKGTMETKNVVSTQYETMVDEKDLLDMRQARRAIMILNEQLFSMMMTILVGLNNGFIQNLKYKEIIEIEETVKKLDAIYALVRKVLPPNMINEFKRDHFYVPVYHMYERIVQEVEKKK